MSAASTDAVSGLLIVDKPQGITSHDVVSRTRRLAHTRRVGHIGSNGDGSACPWNQQSNKTAHVDY